jgi:hypothetical protein
MPIVTLIISILAGAGFWWWRAQRARDAASTLFDIAGHARGAYNRSRFRSKAGASVLAGVEDAGTAAATLLYSLAALKRPLNLADEDKIDQMLETVCRLGRKEREDAMAFAGWASGQVADTAEIVRRFMPLWTRSLQDAERHELLDMASSAAELGGPAIDSQTAVLRRLTEGLFPK